MSHRYNLQLSLVQSRLRGIRGYYDLVVIASSNPLDSTRYRILAQANLRLNSTPRHLAQKFVTHLSSLHTDITYEKQPEIYSGRKATTVVFPNIHIADIPTLKKAVKTIVRPRAKKKNDIFSVFSSGAKRLEGLLASFTT
ncbi:hypothetical protein CO154_00875 [Candidatus Pacearchaeota archaeon CG_4_9_14_3_um_filter_31_7]|nr:MAG: hypothetical protein AUJ10_02810 [Candidatus Pacearchaeota archaeon CG1_02_31_27]PIN92096.1 MAG: hypothetical protein COU55_02830 [Candidatus Pacearchaeota archaeon CG10_big_fil_rev_8_21_14_0_10_31_59]PIZ80311.1 MAG: hypothetical protein COX99_02935 [Candidatus Pacearchaeota archaeon CG_4_10_14_0_2_um_filter_31_10]PJA70827.1 MAG: hypothetical protein CO154_00875 [Candidatus Pacearchaeota archaeon CG_4_9_14_3_um_filter_31_7]